MLGAIGLSFRVAYRVSIGAGFSGRIVWNVMRAVRGVAGRVWFYWQWSVGRDCFVLGAAGMALCVSGLLPGSVAKMWQWNLCNDQLG